MRVLKTRYLAALALAIAAAILSFRSGHVTSPKSERQSTPSLEEHEDSSGHQNKSEDKSRERGPGLVFLYFMGRLGNNLFEYAAARVLADRLGWALFMKAHLNRDKFKTLLKPRGVECFPGVRPLGPSPDSEGMRNLTEVPYRLMSTELADPAPRIIKMASWLQDYKLFASDRERLREIMAFNPNCCGPNSPGPNDLVIHYRNYEAELTPKQYKNLHFEDLDYNYYDIVLQEAVGSAGGRPNVVWLVGEFEEDNALMTRLKQEHSNVRIAEMVSDQFQAFCFLARAPRLVMAQSTFSWWAAFLGNASEVHFPLNKGGVTGMRVTVKDDSRYIYRDKAGRVVNLRP